MKPSRSTYVVWVPIALIALGLGAWALLAGLPFGSDEPQRPATREMEVVDEGRPVTGTVSQINEPGVITQTAAPDDSGIATTTTQAPPLATSPIPPTSVPQTQQPVPQPRTVVVPPPAPRPRPVPQPQPRNDPPPQRASSGGEISESEAVSVLRGYITSRRDYGVRSECLAIGSLGYRNVGYTLDAFDRCDNRSLGRWRVDSKNRDVFRQRRDGRFLRP